MHHQVLAISSVYQNITSARLSFWKNKLHHEFGDSLYKIISKSINKTFKFISERENPYLALQCAKLHHLTTGQHVNEMDSNKLLE